jgi:hypothetical protein
VCAKKYKNRETKPICEARRTQTRTRITLRAGMLEPGRLGPTFLGLVGAIGALGPPLLTNGADAVAGFTAEGADAFTGAEAKTEAEAERELDAGVDASADVPPDRRI